MISIVIPFYNETKRLGSEDTLLEHINSIKMKLTEPFELIFVDDGSHDGTKKLLQRAQAKTTKLSVKIVSYKQNQGKGFAVKKGVASCSGEYIFVMDADFSVSLDEMKKFHKELANFDIVIGSKKHLLTNTLKSQKAPRRILGKGYTVITNQIMRLNFTDITCGFKAFRAPVAKKIFKKQRINRWAYDSESLFIAKKYNHSVKELPVSWYHIEGSTINPLTDTWRSLKDLGLILYNNFRGRYD